MSPQSFALVVAAVVVCCALLALLALLIISESQAALSFDRRLAVPRAQARMLRAGGEERPTGGGGAQLSAVGLELLRAGSMVVPVGSGEREKLARMLRQAGFGQRDALSLYLCVKLAMAVVGAVAAGVAAAGVHGFLVAAAAVGGFVVAGIVPEYLLRGLGARRGRRMGAALPDALDLAVMCLESGLTFSRALATVADELRSIEPSLAREFRMMEAELRIGANHRAVLQDFRDRTEVEGLRDLATTLLQSERYGTPLTQALRNIAAAERLQRAARLTERAERLPVVMTFPMLLLVMPGTVLLVAGPAFLSAIRAMGSLGGG